MHDHTPHRTPPSGNEFNFRDRPEIDVAISATAKELRQAGRLHEALSLLEERIVESFSAKEVDPLVVFQAAKIHAQLSTEPHDSHHSRAQAYLKRLVRDDPHSSFTTQLLGDLYEREGDLKKAATCYILAARNDSNPIPALGKLCGTFLALEQRQLARKAADWMLSLDGDNQMSLTLKVRVDLANGDVVSARDAVSKLLKLAPDTAISWGQKTQVELAAKDIQAARRASDRHIELSPDNALAWGLRTQVEVAAGDWKAARYAANVQLKLAPEDMYCWGQKTQVELGAGDIDAAKNAANRHLEIAPNEVIPWCLKAQVELAAGDTAAARMAVNRGLALAPHHGVAWGMKTQVELAARNIPAARSAANRYLEMEPENVVALCLKTQVELAAGDCKAAKAAVNALLKLEPRNLVGLGLKARVELAGGDITAAKKALNTQLKIAPANEISWGIRTQIALREGDLAAAEQAMDALRKIDPMNPRALLYEGRIALQKNDIPTARKCGAMLIKHFHPTHLFYLRCLVVLGHFDAKVYESLVQGLKRDGKVAGYDKRFSLGSGRADDALQHLDYELFTFSDDRGEYTRSGIFTTNLIPVPINGLATDVASNGDRKVWGPLFKKQNRPLKLVEGDT